MFIDRLIPGKDASIVNTSHIVPKTPIYSVRIIPNSGADTLLLDKYKGKKILIVNTASNCGYTAQYDELEKLYKKYQDRMVIIGFPSNDFMGQEPKDDKTIAQFCKINYGVTFPLMKKSSVLKGNLQNEIYKWLTDSSKNGWCNQQPTWNFSKYLINEQGVLTHFFKQTISPLDKRVTDAIEKK